MGRNKNKTKKALKTDLPVSPAPKTSHTLLPGASSSPSNLSGSDNQQSGSLKTELPVSSAPITGHTPLPGSPSSPSDLSDLDDQQSGYLNRQASDHGKKQSKGM